ncbi:hypothetical protein JCGZ_21732 [Jatropha curcas]|uniref:Protein SHORT HYPOCOTYL IN WHITE LIGHT 1 n=1 Tax=Jatropha curcas TaxID=180498 RepID=A0A067JBS2_JATCU|nr:protein SHORT HYPOCOTYL IN WHITE LIGHT 1 [Jatropha curcas]KDP21261.1 hypothetical protein JCGZ_21732 [Jatropha curcas]
MAAVVAPPLSSSQLSCTAVTSQPTKLLFHSSLSQPRHQYFRFHNLTTLYRNPNIIICHGKLDGEELEEIDGEVYFDDNDTIEDDSDGDETESSIDLLIRFFQSMFKKVSKRAKKASRSILPSVISPQLVSFAVDGIMLLAALSIVKALLEVVCTLGTTVFTVILILRVIWAAISFFQSSGNTFNQGGSSFGSTQPMA